MHLTPILTAWNLSPPMLLLELKSINRHQRHSRYSLNTSKEGGPVEMLLETNQSKPIPNLKELPMLWERPKGKQQKQRMPVIVESPSESFSVPKEPLIEDARLAVGVHKQRNGESRGNFSPTNQSNKLNRKGDFGDVSLVELEVTEMNNKASNVISPEITSPGVGFSLANQSAEPSNLLAWPGGKAVEAEEPSTGKITNRVSDNVDDQSNKDGRALVQELQTLVQSEDAKQTAETTIQETLLEENRSELSERSSEKRFEIPLEKAEETSVINPSDEQGSSHTENFLEAVEMQEISADSILKHIMLRLKMIMNPLGFKEAAQIPLEEKNIRRDLLEQNQLGQRNWDQSREKIVIKGQELKLLRAVVSSCNTPSNSNAVE
ncbi:hypothetical protein EZV62_013839 [Acer yangbiense]|uniref:Uncharacterized protein n=1 Tax=Acer yangbiense TaxID=1000413 RepID=A0A5C7HSL0_9ROSI|nr:hypothetical protein EZV62_013839 [Acer yangbiense]